jgi:hypothetical protein
MLVSVNSDSSAASFAIIAEYKNAYIISGSTTFAPKCDLLIWCKVCNILYFAPKLGFSIGCKVKKDDYASIYWQKKRIGLINR